MVGHAWGGELKVKWRDCTASRNSTSILKGNQRRSCSRVTHAPVSPVSVAAHLTNSSVLSPANASSCLPRKVHKRGVCVCWGHREPHWRAKPVSCTSITLPLSCSSIPKDLHMEVAFIGGASMGGGWINKLVWRVIPWKY